MQLVGACVQLVSCAAGDRIGTACKLCVLEVPALFEIERDDATVGLDGEQLVPVGLGLHVSIGRAQVGYVPPVLRGGKYGASEEAS